MMMPEGAITDKVSRASSSYNRYDHTEGRSKYNDTSRSVGCAPPKTAGCRRPCPRLKMRRLKSYATGLVRAAAWRKAAIPIGPSCQYSIGGMRNGST